MERTAIIPKKILKEIKEGDEKMSKAFDDIKAGLEDAIAWQKVDMYIDQDE